MDAHLGNHADDVEVFLIDDAVSNLYDESDGGDGGGGGSAGKDDGENNAGGSMRRERVVDHLRCHVVEFRLISAEMRSECAPAGRR